MLMNVMTSVTSCQGDLDPIDVDIVTLQQDCPEIGPFYKYHKSGILPDDVAMARRIAFTSDQYGLANNVLYHFYQPRTRNAYKATKSVAQIVIPKQLRYNRLSWFHCGYGFDRTREAILQKYYWPGMKSDILDYQQSCLKCQRAKDIRQKRPLCSHCLLLVYINTGTWTSSDQFEMVMMVASVIFYWSIPFHDGLRRFAYRLLTQSRWQRFYSKKFSLGMERQQYLSVTGVPVYVLIGQQFVPTFSCEALLDFALSSPDQHSLWALQFIPFGSLENLCAGWPSWLARHGPCVSSTCSLSLRKFCEHQLSE